MTQTKVSFKIIGVTDETCVCEKCGKTNLKKVVVLENIDTGEIVRYGTDCASRAMGVAKKSVDSEYDNLMMVTRWIAKGVTPAQVAEALRNRGWGGEIKNGFLMTRAFKVPFKI